jgi:putative membrane protein
MVLSATAPAAALSAAQTDGDRVQIEAYRLTQSTPASIEDKLFILTEYSGALRERDFAKMVLERTRDAQIAEFAKLVRDGHQLGMERMDEIAGAMKFPLPSTPTEADKAMIAAAAQLAPGDLDRYFLVRQHAMHAWDITIFESYATRVRDPALAAYVRETIAPLRKHAQQLIDLSKDKGMTGNLVVIGAQASPQTSPP